MDLTQITELYAAVYDQDLREEILSVEEDFEFVDELSDNDLDKIMESILGEGEVTLSECAYAFDGALLQEQSTLSEARPTARSQAERAQRRSERAGEREASVNAKRREDRITRVKSAVDRAKTTAAGVASAAAGGAAELGRKAKAGAEKLTGKLKSAKEKIKGFVGRVGRAAKAGYSAAKSELSGEAGRQSDLKRNLRTNLRNARASSRAAAGKDTSAFDGPSRKSSGVGRREKVSSGSAPSSPMPAPGSFSGSERRKAAAMKLAKAASGTSARGIRFAGTQAGQAASQRASSDIQGKRAKFAKSIGVTTEELNIILNNILEDLINEGYANNIDEAFDIIESLSYDETESLVESYLEEETYDVYDVILEYLCTEGYADTLEDAETIMVNMSEDWRDTILDEATSAPTVHNTKPTQKQKVEYQYSEAEKEAAKSRRDDAVASGKRKRKLEFDVK
jgi:hypothetical protein